MHHIDFRLIAISVSILIKVMYKEFHIKNVKLQFVSSELLTCIN